MVVMVMVVVVVVGVCFQESLVLKKKDGKK